MIDLLSLVHQYGLIELQKSISDYLVIKKNVILIFSASNYWNELDFKCCQCTYMQILGALSPGRSYNGPETIKSLKNGIAIVIIYIYIYSKSSLYRHSKET